MGSVSDKVTLIQIWTCVKLQYLQGSPSLAKFECFEISMSIPAATGLDIIFQYIAIANLIAILHHQGLEHDTTRMHYMA